ncbi:MAG: FRG domain-containing protein [Chloroflexi bacterium]|nr:FRG domain-containing protein [Chloroflexota bacterium]
MSNVRSEEEAAWKLIGELCGHFGCPGKNSEFIFRGEPDADNANVSCSLLRKVNGVQGSKISVRFSAKDMMRRLTAGAAPYVGGDIVGREFETLAAMQHYGAATPLIDFSEDWRIALYFACERDEGKDGRIIYFTEKRAKKRYDLKIERPRTHHHDDAGRLAGRQIDQQSVLVWAENGKFEPRGADTVCIPKNLKPHMLAWLRSRGLREDVIYNDLHHYIGQFNENQNSSVAILLADALLGQCDWHGAIGILKDALGITRGSYKSITLIEQRGKAYRMLAQAYKGLGTNDIAIKYYEQSARLLQSKDNGIQVRLDAEDCAKANGCPEQAAEFRAEIKHLW